MLTPEGGVKVVVENFERLFVSSVEDDFDGILKVDRHLVRLKIILGLLGETVLGPHLLALKAENAPWLDLARFRLLVFSVGFLRSSVRFITWLVRHRLQ